MSIEPTSSALPPWPGFVGPILDVLANTAEVRRKDLSEQAVADAGLTPEAAAEMLPSGKTTRALDRAKWAIMFLARAGYIEPVRRGIYSITAAGRAWNEQLERPITDLKSIERELGELWKLNTPSSGSETAPAPAGTAVAESTQTPTEQVEEGMERLREQLAAELLDKLRNNDPDFFEDAVVKLLLAMGYGGAEQRGKVTSSTGDGGVDGVIDQDALGLDQVYVQAKRYAAGNNVGRPEVQGFVGALHGFGASRGVFITTSAFSQGALEYAHGVPTRIILIDGQRLANLMIKYKVGVQVKTTYEVVEIDEDFFE